MDDRLDLMDQGSFLGLRALGHHPCTLLTWTYDRPVDVAALRRYNERLCSTLLGRLVQTSPLPGGRHRWVAVSTPSPVEVEPVARAREQIAAWTDELAERGVDPEHGPGWRIGVLPLTDGGTAVAMVGSHTLGDGHAKLNALAAAAVGPGRRPAYRARGDRNRLALWCADLADLVRSLPSVARAVVAGLRVARASSESAPVAVAARPGAEPTAGPFRPPSVCVRIEQARWDEEAQRRGGTSNTLVAGVAARLADRLGRVGPDGRVSLAVPVSVRVAGDTRANALDQIDLDVDPGALAHDLAGLRAATKSALVERAERSHDLVAVLPLIPFTPRAVVRRTEHLALGSGPVVGCSNHGDVPAAVMRIDGADADDFWVRLAEPGQSAADLDRIGGQLYVLSGRALGQVYLSVVARTPGGGPEPDHLAELVTQTLAEFGLSALAR